MATATKTARTRAERRYEWLVALGRYVGTFISLPAVSLPNIDTPDRLDDITEEFIDDAAEATRRHWKLGDGPISNVVWLLENNGFIIGQSSLWGEKLDALSDIDDELDGRPYLILGLDKRSAVRSRFDAAHELAHVVLHRNIDRSRIFKSGSPEFEIIENQAHRFAGAFLLPRDAFSNDFRYPTLDAFLGLKKKWLASIQMMTSRCGQLGLLSEEQVRHFHINISRRKWRQREPFDDTMVPEQPRLLKRSLEMMIENGVQSREQVLESLPIPASDIEELASLDAGYLTRAPEIVRLREHNDKILKFPGR